MSKEFEKTIKKLKLWAFFSGKILLLTTLFTIGRILLLGDQQPHTPSGDHMMDENPPTIKQQFDEQEVVPQQQQKEAQAIIQQLLDSIDKEDTFETKQHASAGLSPQEIEKNMNLLCTVFADICNKTVRDSDFSELQRLFYQAVIIAKIRSLDDLLLPGKVRDTLSYVKLLEDEDQRRGSAGHTYIKLNTSDMSGRDEFQEVMTHEFGHVIDLGLLVGTSRKKDEIFTEFGRPQWAVDDPSIDFYKLTRNAENVKNPQTTPMDFVSGYAMKGVYEDFAEGVNMYLNHNAVFRKMMDVSPLLTQKYEFYERIFGGEYFSSSQSIAQRLSSTERVRDSTRLD